MNVDTITGDMPAMGVFGLAPGEKDGVDQSFLMALYNQDEIPKPIVGVNFEDPANKQQTSSMTFGYYDFNLIHGGVDGVYNLTNVGTSHWAIELHKMTIGGFTLDPV